MQRNDHEKDDSLLANDPTTTKLQRDRLMNKIEDIRLNEAALKTSLVSNQNTVTSESTEKHVDFELMAKLSASEKGPISIDLKKAFVLKTLKAGQELGLMSY